MAVHSRRFTTVTGWTFELASDVAGVEAPFTSTGVFTFDKAQQLEFTAGGLDVGSTFADDLGAKPVARMGFRGGELAISNVPTERRDLGYTEDWWIAAWTGTSSSWITQAIGVGVAGMVSLLDRLDYRETATGVVITSRDPRVEGPFNHVVMQAIPDVGIFDYFTPRDSDIAPRAPQHGGSRARSGQLYRDEVSGERYALLFAYAGGVLRGTAGDGSLDSATDYLSTIEIDWAA